MEEQCPCIPYAVRHGPIGKFAAQAAIRMNRPTTFFMNCGPSLHEYIELHKQGPAKKEQKAMSFKPESNFITAEDLTEGQDTVVTIEGMEEAQLGDKKKWLLKFKEMRNDNGEPRPLILNKTRTLALIEATGTDDEEEVVGKKILLYVGEATFKGATYSVPLIRKKAPKAGTKAAKPSVADDDDFPG